VLVAAIVALVLIALLITGAFFASGQDLTISRAELRDEQAFGYAELAVSQALESWDATARETMSVGETVTLETASDPPLESSVFITRLDSALYIVAGEGRLRTADGYGLRRRVGITVQTIVGGGRVSRPERVPGQAWSELY
jgi:hypothetical protein